MPLAELDWEPPAERIISSAVLEAQYRQVQMLNCADKDAATIINAARRKAEKIIREAHKASQNMQAEMRREEAKIRQETLSRCEAQWLQSHVISLLQGEALEQQVVKTLLTRIQHSIKQVLSAWFDQQSVDDVLCDRLARQAEQMVNEGALTLHIHPSMREAMVDEFGTRFTLILEPDFACDRAVLSSCQLSVEFSLSDHFQELLTWLRPQPSEL